MSTDDIIPNMEKITTVLVSFIGNRDPYPDNEEEPGPLLSFLLHNQIDEAYLLCSSTNYLERAKDLEQELCQEGIRTKISAVDFSITDVIDYSEIWKKLTETLTGIKMTIEKKLPKNMKILWKFLLDSGTPQMKTSLFLLSQLDLFQAELYQGIPPQFAGGTYKSRKVVVSGIPCFTNIPCNYKNNITSFGNDPQFIMAYEKAVKAATYDDPVFLLGETGTGKTLIAKHIHEKSKRKLGPFVEVNCSAIPKELAESELFGHTRGAFSGAEKMRSGKFRAAHNGTLFLDEIGDLPLELQAKLLKAIEDKQVYPVGSDEPLPADIRLIAATNKNLKEMVQQGYFRRDLYERLKVIVINLPPLRERGADIEYLAGIFLNEWNSQYNENKILSKESLDLIKHYAWPGNVRELRNTIRSCACVALNSIITPEYLPDELKPDTQCFSQQNIKSNELVTAIQIPQEGINLKAKLLQIEWEYFAQALRQTGNNREAAAKLLGMTGHTFRKALRERLAGFLDEETDP